MAKIGNGYGSEWHLLWHLGYWRNYLSKKILDLTGGNSIEWLDFNFSNSSSKSVSELKGLEFIKNTKVQQQWESFWPQSGNPHNWDAIGKIHFSDHFEWLFVEAKAHTGELKSLIGAKNKASIQKIRDALEKTALAFGNTSQPIDNWLKPYYQFANRLAVLYFLMNECKPAEKSNMLFLYFYGDKNPQKDCCPKNESGWKPKINDIYNRLGIDKNCNLAKRVHTLFLPTVPR